MKKITFLFISSMLCIISDGYANNVNSLKINNYILPRPLEYALYEGIKVPVFIQYDHFIDKEKKVADALISLSNGVLELKNISLIETENHFLLNKDSNELLKTLNDVKFDNNKTITLNENLNIIFDIYSFTLVLDVKKETLEPIIKKKKYNINNSSIETISSVLNYNIGLSQSFYKNNDSFSTNFLDLNLITSKREHHLDINANFYNIGQSAHQFSLSKMMYEKDFGGFKTSFGLLNSWNLQSSANISALSSSNIYAFSVGNNSSSKKTNKQYSIIPIIVFLPSPGDVRIYREGKLISIQNYAMGSFEVDTSSVPYGIYDVTVETVVNGKVTSSQVQKINKPFYFDNNSSDEFTWELYGGYMSLKNQYSSSSEKQSKSGTYLIGYSIAKRFAALYGLNVQMSNYAFLDNIVNETTLNLNLSGISLNWQTLLANHGNYRNILSTNIDIPKNMGSVWGSYEKSNINERLLLSSSKSYSLGISLNFNNLYNRLGYFNMSYQKDIKNRTNYINYNYSNNLYNGKYGSVGFRAGIQKNINNDRTSIIDRYLSFDFSIPFSTWASLGLSSSNNNANANLSINKNFNDSFITNAGATLSKNISGNDSTPVSVFGFANFDNKYSSGSITINRSISGFINSNLRANGSIAYSDVSISASGKQGKSGIIIKSDQIDDSVMAAKINGLSYKINGSNTFIPLNAYQEYNIQLMNSANSLDSFDIVTEKNKSFTLYPGNVAVMRPKIKKIVTVFGRIKYINGEIANNMAVHNHIGKTVTDSKGEFAMDIDIAYPIITVVDENKKPLCQKSVNLKEAKGALWIGDITCAENLIVKR